MNSNFSQIIVQYKKNKQSVHNIWFIDIEERLKSFRPNLVLKKYNNAPGKQVKRQNK
ncbi:hypothetical protein TEGAF0_08460 [Sediminibacterium sp. TEGAF015]|jgi:hypothetical protein|nr:hypothetical protein TEGAF0_08460 [Sediminibacterium sp. TEGAF015]